MIENIKKSLKKVKRSVQSDIKEYKYKFLNLVEINFSDYLFSVAIALATVLPTIIPKFIEFYKVK